MSLGDLLSRRLGQAALALALLSVVAFALPRLAGGDPAVALYGAEASAADRDVLRERLGLDRPLLEQYARWAGAALRGDFGRSSRTGESALVAVGARVPATLLLAAGSLTVGIVLGCLLGAGCALAAGSRTDRLGAALAAALTAAPGFWVGMLLLFVFAYRLGWLPYGGLGPTDSAAVFAPEYLFLPSLALGSREVGRIALLLRAGMLDALAEPYTRVAAAKGLSRLAVGLRHALPNALVPVVSSAGVGLAYLLGGAVAVETVFGWPGLGRLMAESAASRDLPVLAVGILVAGTAALLASLLADLGYLLVDPRARSEALAPTD